MWRPEGQLIQAATRRENQWGGVSLTKGLTVLHMQLQDLAGLEPSPAINGQTVRDLFHNNSAAFIQAGEW
jgi:hypothetical protein